MDLKVDLKMVFDAIRAKSNQYTLLDRYYSGDQPTVYLTQRLRDIFRGVDIDFVENWCSVVIDTCMNRINLSGFRTTDAGIQSILENVWNTNEMDLESEDIHLASLVNGESFLIVWPNEETGTTDVYYNDPRMVEVVYDPSNPRKKLFAGKLWCDVDGTARITLYYPDHLEYYASTAKFENVSSVNSFKPMLEPGANWPVNPYNTVPVFHFRTNRWKISDLKNVIPLQNGCNKLLSDMVVAAEYGAFKQRWVISSSETFGKVSSQPGSVIDLPAGDGAGQDTSVGEFSATDLKNYLDAIDNIAGAIGKITATPKHYFYSQGGDPSGEALIAMEAPLNKKAAARIERFTPVWQQVGVFIAQIAGKQVDPQDIIPVFDQPETIQPKTSAEIVKILTDAQMPLKTALRNQGWTDPELEQMDEDMKKQKQSESSMATALLEKLRIQQEQDTSGAAMTERMTNVAGLPLTVTEGGPAKASPPNNMNMPGGK